MIRFYDNFLWNLGAELVPGAPDISFQNQEGHPVNQLPYLAPVSEGFKIVLTDNLNPLEATKREVISIRGPAQEVGPNMDYPIVARALDGTSQQTWPQGTLAFQAIDSATLNQHLGFDPARMTLTWTDGKITSASEMVAIVGGSDDVEALRLDLTWVGDRVTQVDEYINKTGMMPTEPDNVYVMNYDNDDTLIEVLLQ